MSRDPLPTPYDGSSPLFQVGARPLDPAAWIEADARLGDDLTEKARLFREQGKAVFAAEPGTEAAQSEVLTLLVAHLCKTFPGVWRRDGETIIVRHSGEKVALRADEPALMTAARLVQEDLILMRRGADGWRLVAAAVCFASSWRLEEKFGRPIHEVHEPVPGFGAGTRGAELIARMFGAMRPETPMLRWNWSLYGDDARHHPHEPPPLRFGEGDGAPRIFLRIERQTLRKLPGSGDILFTIRVRIDPIAALVAHEKAAAIIAALIAQVEALTPEQLAYKGLTEERGRLLTALGRLLEARSLAPDAEP